MGNSCRCCHPKPKPAVMVAPAVPTTVLRDRVKLLLLGAGESGKSTLFKQMKLNYVQGYKVSDLLEEKEKIIRAFLMAFKDYMEAIRNKYGVISENLNLEELASTYFPEDKKGGAKSLTDGVVKFIKDIWTSDRGMDIWDNHFQFPITDSLAYFYGHIDRLAPESYVPTEMDYLKCRVVSAGIVEQTFEYKGVLIVVVDVGGQRAERKKWAQCMHNVEAVLFVASLSEFDQKLFEDATVERIGEAKTLFKKTFGFMLFREKQFVLFLNKQDLLHEKIKRLENKKEDLNRYFPHLRLGKNYKNAAEIIQEDFKDQFLSVVGYSDRVVPHFVTATDKALFTQVFQAATQVVLKNAISHHFT